MIFKFRARHELERIDQDLEFNLAEKDKPPLIMLLS